MNILAFLFIYLNVIYYLAFRIFHQFFKQSFRNPAPQLSVLYLDSLDSRGTKALPLPFQSHGSLMRLGSASKALIFPANHSLSPQCLLHTHTRLVLLSFEQAHIPHLICKTINTLLNSLSFSTLSMIFAITQVHCGNYENIENHKD